MTSQGFDAALDALFKSSAGASVAKPQPRAPIAIPTPTAPAVAKPSTSTKRKHEKGAAFADTSSAKRRRQDGKKKSQPQSQEDSSDEEDTPAVEDAYTQRSKKPVTTSKKPVAPKSSQAPPRKPSPKPSNSDSGPDPDPDSDSGSNADSDSGSDPDAPPPQHESLSTKPTQKKKHIPENESPEQKDARTIYIGNLPASVAKSSARKALQKHVLRCLASAYPNHPKPQIESSRFRSVAFKSPTSTLPSDALSPKTGTQSKSSTSTKSAETSHNRTRAAEWRAAQEGEGGGGKTFQTPAQKKKTAYILGDVHESGRSSASAYVVFAYPPPPSAKSAPGEPKSAPNTNEGDGEEDDGEGEKPAWDPAEVASRAVQACNGSVFMDRTLRVDRVGKSREGVEEERADPRTMVFVGNLDFEVDEDAVRALFEGLVEKERGKVGQEEKDGEEGSSSEGEEEEEDEEGSSSEEENAEEDEEDEEGTNDEADETTPNQPSPAKPPTPTPAKSWVKSVRIIRDKDTQLGKGFGYDRTSADEILAMEPGTIKLAKRKLRVQRCKTLPGATRVVKAPKVERGQKTDRRDSSKGDRKDSSKGDRKDLSKDRKDSSKDRKDRNDLSKDRDSKPRTARPNQIQVPRADPTLGDRIRSLSKEERKSVKASDADRIARRLAKKKAKHALEKGARKDAAKSKSGILGGRMAKGGASKLKGKGKRERSDKALLKKNVKK